MRRASARAARNAALWRVSSSSSCSLRSVSVGELAAPGVLLVGAGLGQGQRGQPDDDGLPLGGGAGDLGPGVGAQEPAEVAEPPLPLQDGPLPGQDLAIARPVGDPHPRRGREEGIEMETEHVGHGHLLSFGLGVGGQVEVVPADVHRLLEEGLGGGVVPLRLQQPARLFRLVAVSGWRSPSTALWIARACSKRGLAAA